MYNGKYVFAQLIEFLPQKAFQRIVMKYQGDKYIKSFSCWNQLLIMMFGQLSGCESLRELVCILSAHTPKSYHLGFGKSSITRSNLSKANANRDNNICIRGYFVLARLFKINLIGSNFVIRERGRLQYEIIEGEDFLENSNNVLHDQLIRLKGQQTTTKYPSLLRRVVY
jgi:hypothetical protein